MLGGARVGCWTGGVGRGCAGSDWTGGACRDDGCWAFIESFLAATAAHPAARWVDAPTAFRIRTVSPMAVSLKGYDIKPRDLAGRFLSGALEKVGNKIIDIAQVSLDITARRR